MRLNDVQSCYKSITLLRSINYVARIFVEFPGCRTGCINIYLCIDFEKILILTKRIQNSSATQRPFGHGILRVYIHREDEKMFTLLLAAFRALPCTFFLPVSLSKQYIHKYAKAKGKEFLLFFRQKFSIKFL